MKKIYRYFCKFETILACAGFFTIIAMTFGNAVLRLLNKPIPTSDDICTLLFAWVSFLGADIAMRSNRLVSMNLATMNLPVKVQKTLSLIVYGIMIAILCLFAVKGYQLARMNWARFFNMNRIWQIWMPAKSIFRSARHTGMPCSTGISSRARRQSAARLLSSRLFRALQWALSKQREMISSASMPIRCWISSSSAFPKTIWTF